MHTLLFEADLEAATDAVLVCTCGGICDVSIVSAVDEIIGSVGIVFIIFSGVMETYDDRVVLFNCESDLL